MLANREDDEVDCSAVIPPNFTDSGMVFNTFKTRNFIEAIIFGILPGWGVYNFIFPDITKEFAVALLIVLFIFGPIAGICLLGINGDAVTVFLWHVIKFFKRKKNMRYRRITTESLNRKKK